MRKFFFVLGIVFGLLLIVVAGGFAFIAYLGMSGDKNAKQYADDSVIAITAKWDVKELRARATPELIKQVKPDDLESMFAWFATLGRLIDYAGSKQVNWRSFVGTEGSVILIDYSGVGKYKEGPATIKIEVKQQNGQWRVNGLRVDSSRLIENKVGRGS